MLLFILQLALVLILVHAVFTGVQAVRSNRKNWFHFAYRLAIAYIAFYFLLDYLT
ncbi:hypothetical protein [Hazenella coriacea]|uniref:Uncharacterized protein n=1 Tax=Hazenella coriacea TaxID=1179467 RepID=A0A4R3L2T5_9BACL|nr:hypothetical protein [Hazenella coriacea]TCS93961.1 hypothetical protein EDD58_105172 [Hazenella coriacea]